MKLSFYEALQAINDGTTFIRVGYGGVIVESLADAMRHVGPHPAV